MKLTLSVRSFQVPATPLHVGLAAELAFGSHFAGHAGHFRRERPELIDHRVDGVLQFEDFAADVDGDLLRQVAGGDGLGDVGDVADLAGQVAGHHVDAVGQVLPRAGDALDVGLAAQLSFRSHFAGHAGDFRGKRAQLIDHRVDGVLQLEDFSLDVDGDFLGQVAVGDGGRHFGDVADLAGEVARHAVDAVGEAFPRAGDALHVGLAAELAFGPHFAGDAGHLGGERSQLVDHRVDGVLELLHLALDVDRDFSGQVAVGDGLGHFGDVADLARQVARHAVDAFGQVFPRAGDALHASLSAQLSFGPHFARHAGHFAGE